MCSYRKIKYHHPTENLSSQRKVRNRDIPIMCFYFVYLKLLHEINLGSG